MSGLRFPDTPHATIHAFRSATNEGVSSRPMNDIRVLYLKQTKMTYFPKNKVLQKIQLRLCGEVCLAFVCVFYFFWLSASHDLRLGMDGMLLALCDHGFERSG